MSSAPPATPEAPPLRVLFVSHAYPRHEGDTPGLFVHRLAVALSQQHVEVSVLAPSGPGLAPNAEIDGIRIRRFRYAPARHERLAYTGTMAETVKASVGGKLALLGMLAAGRHALRRALRQAPVDLVHAHWWFPSGLTVRSAQTGLPLLTTLHGSDVRLALGTRGASRLYRSVAGASATTTAVSRWLAERAAALAPDIAPPVVAPMPVDTELFTPRGPRDPDRLLFVGRLNAQKGATTLLRALAQLPQIVTLDVVGDGPDAGVLRGLAEQLGLGPRVRWLGRLEQRALAERYARAAALVVPSIDEGLGLVAVEAALCETPVVAARSGGLPDVVEDGVTGLLVTPGDAQALGTGILQLRNRADGGTDLGREGRRRALERFAPARVATRYRALYVSALRRTAQDA